MKLKDIKNIIIRSEVCLNPVSTTVENLGVSVRTLSKVQSRRVVDDLLKASCVSELLKVEKYLQELRESLTENLKRTLRDIERSVVVSKGLIKDLSMSSAASLLDCSVMIICPSHLFNGEIMKVEGVTKDGQLHLCNGAKTRNTVASLTQVKRIEEAENV